MTLRTIAPEFILMHIFMAAYTIIGWHAKAVLKNGYRGGIHIMASRTVHQFVFSFQREMGFAVVEFFYAT